MLFSCRQTFLLYCRQSFLLLLQSNFLIVWTITFWYCLVLGLLFFSISNFRTLISIQSGGVIDNANGTILTNAIPWTLDYIQCILLLKLEKINYEYILTIANVYSSISHSNKLIFSPKYNYNLFSCFYSYEKWIIISKNSCAHFY